MYSCSFRAGQAHLSLLFSDWTGILVLLLASDAHLSFWGTGEGYLYSPSFLRCESAPAIFQVHISFSLCCYTRLVRACITSGLPGPCVVSRTTFARLYMGWLRTRAPVRKELRCATWTGWGTFDTSPESFQGFLAAVLRKRFEFHNSQTMDPSLIPCEVEFYRAAKRRCVASMVSQNVIIIHDTFGTCSF